MTQDVSYKPYIVPALIVLVMLVGFYLISGRESPLGGAPQGMQTAVATSSNPTVGTTALLVFATSTGCTSRVVTTYASPVVMYFSNRIAQTPSGVAGHLQAASTTVAYDSGLYGCGAVYMYGFTSTAITVSEFAGYN